MTDLSDRFDLLTQEQAEAVEKELEFSLADRLKAVIYEIGLDESVRIAGKSDKQLKRYMSGDEPPFSVLEKLANKAGVSLDWLASGERRTTVERRLDKLMLISDKSVRWRRLKQSLPPEPENTMLEYGINLAERLMEVIDREEDTNSSGQQSQSQSTVPYDKAANYAGDFIALPFLDIEASAGHGAVVAIHEEVRSVVSFERAFLRNLGAVPDHCKIIGARGDSMTPTIPDGALIVVDHSQREVVNGWISVVNVCGDLLVKRIRRRLDGTVELVSDNTIYPVETIGPDRIDQLTIIGRVVYFCRAP